MSTEHLFPDKYNFLGEENAQTKHTRKLLHINNPDEQMSLLIETFCFMLGTVLRVVAHSVSPVFFFKYSLEDIFYLLFRKRGEGLGGKERQRNTDVREKH